VETFAQRHGLGSGPAIRLLIGYGLCQEAMATGAGESPLDSAAALAALTAAEHAVLMVASVLPEGQRRLRELSPAAATAAAERLALFKGPVID
jgi:hypothetical protein